MSEKIMDGGSAFPVSTQQSNYREYGNYGHQDGQLTWQFGGISVRDYFAAQSIQSAFELAIAEKAWEAGDDWRIGVAMDAYAMADAMLIVREAREVQP